MSVLSGKKILVLGAGRGNLGLVKAAKRNGVSVLLVGMGGDYPCNPYADKLCYGDISDPDVVLRIAEEEEVDGVAICCSDTGLRAVGRCNDVLGLSGISEDAAMLSADKALMKEKLLAAGVRTPKSVLVRTESELEDALSRLHFPLIVKAVDLQGSRGLSIVRSAEDAVDAFRNSLSLSKKRYCLVEEFVDGEIIGADAFVYGGKVFFVLPHGNETFYADAPVPVGHSVPLDVAKELLDDVEQQVVASIRALGLNNCAVNVDVVVRDGKAYVIELTGRVGANCLPELVGNYFSFDFYEVILSACLGVSPLHYFDKEVEPVCSMARMLRSEEDGMVKSIDLPTDVDAYVHLFIKPGTEVRRFTNCNDAIGEVVVKGETLRKCKLSLDGVVPEILKGIKL